VNWAVMVAVLLATVGFGSSSALASAYGIAVTITMFITTLLTFFVVRYVWNYSLAVALGATSLFLLVDAILVVSCSLKIWQGGWFPLVMGAAIFSIMATWKRGRELLIEHIRSDDPELLPFITSLAEDTESQRIPRTAVYAVANPDTVPQALMHNMKHYQVLHEQNLILTVKFAEVPRVPPEERTRVKPLVDGFWRVEMSYGFMDEPDIPKALEQCAQQGLNIDHGAICRLQDQAWRNGVSRCSRRCRAMRAAWRTSSGCRTTALSNWGLASRSDCRQCVSCGIG
jgi:KUP system potassium uptake protein